MFLVFHVKASMRYLSIEFLPGTKPPFEVTADVTRNGTLDTNRWNLEHKTKS